MYGRQKESAGGAWPCWERAITHSRMAVGKQSSVYNYMLSAYLTDGKIDFKKPKAEHSYFSISKG